MKTRILHRVCIPAVVLTALLSQGCAANLLRYSSSGYRKDTSPPYFTGSASELKWSFMCLAGIDPFNKKFQGPVLTIAIPFLLADLPLSLLADMYYLPDDYRNRERQLKRRRERTEKNVAGNSLPDTVDLGVIGHAPIAIEPVPLPRSD